MNTGPFSRVFLARFFLFGAAIIWGSSFFMVKGVVDHLPPATLLAVRFSIGTLILALIFQKKLKGLRRRDLVQGGIMGMWLAAGSLVQGIGILDTTPGKNAFLTGIYCVIVPFLFWASGGKRPPLRSFLAAFLCLLGIGLVSLTETLRIGKGDLLTLISGFLFAVHIVSVARRGEGMDPIALCILQFASTALFCWIYALIVEGNPFAFDWRPVWKPVLYLALGPTTLAFLFQMMGLRLSTPSAASLILSLESVFGVLFSALFYGERMTFRLVLGFSVIFAAVLISEYRPREREVTS
jgi:drug/metabolite transporter (DMT)-like permease